MNQQYINEFATTSNNIYRPEPIYNEIIGLELPQFDLFEPQTPIIRQELSNYVIISLMPNPVAIVDRNNKKRTGTSDKKNRKKSGWQITKEILTALDGKYK